MSRTLLFLVLLSFGSMVSTLTCKYKNDRSIGNRCYSFVTKKHTYKSAREYCHSHGFFLAVVDNLSTANFLAALAGQEFGQTTGQFWIGLFRNVDYSLFQWDDGTQVAFTNFERGYPNIYNGVTESINNGRWETHTEYNSFEFVCSYDPELKTTTISTTTVTTTTFHPKSTQNVYPTTTTTTTSIVPTTTKRLGCPEGFTKFDGDGKCYTVVVYGDDSSYPDVPDDAPPLTREAQRCAKYGSNLATVHSEDLNDLLRSLIYERFNDTRYATFGMKNLNESVDGGDWEWFDNSKKDFLIWGESFPRTSDTIAQTSTNGYWVTTSHTAPNEGVVCSI